MSREEFEVYEIEAFIGERVQNGHTEFKLKWKGYSIGKSNWEPEEKLDCQEIFE